MFRQFWAAAFCVIAIGAIIYAASSPPLPNDNLNVQVSIKPVHSLVSFISQGAFKPGLLMTGQESAHTQSLTPEQLQSLQKADLIIWIGPAYESHWGKRITQHINPEKVLTLIQNPSLTLYPYRQQDECHDHDHDHHGIDGHIWLDLKNAGLMAANIADILGKKDPKNADLYLKNLQVLRAKITDLETALKKKLAPIHGKSYLIYHDGLQYFDRYFGFKMAASLVNEPDLPLNAHHLLKIKQGLSSVAPDQRPGCIFSEPAFIETLSENLAKEFHLNHQKLDYIGQMIPAGPDAYFLMMHQIADDFVKGLSLP